MCAVRTPCIISNKLPVYVNILNINMFEFLMKALVIFLIDLQFYFAITNTSDLKCINSLNHKSFIRHSFKWNFIGNLINLLSLLLLSPSWLVLLQYGISKCFSCEICYIVIYFIVWCTVIWLAINHLESLILCRHIYVVFTFWSESEKYEFLLLQYLLTIFRG